MSKRWEDNFDSLLVWLDQDRERAGVKYEEIRGSLINLFSWRGFKNADELADETIGRVAGKVDDIAKDFEGDPARYFYGVARRMFFETYKKEQRIRFVPTESAALATNESPSTEDEQDLDCLDDCLKHLSSADRELILLYYEPEQPKIQHRKKLAESVGLSQNGLRLKTFRIRTRLQTCVEDCLETSAK